jgi:hypothetical protein
MADDELDQDVFDSLEREASEFTKVCLFFPRRWRQSKDLANAQSQDAEIDRIRSAFALDA